MCPIEAILKFSHEDCTRLEDSTLVNLLAVTKELFTVLTKFFGEIRNITGRLVCGGLMW